MNITNKLMLVGFASVVLTLGGCYSKSDQPPIALVTGNVRLAGKPLAGAMVQFHPAHGRPSGAITDAEGAYDLTYKPTVKGAVIGDGTIVVSVSGAEAFTSIEKDSREVTVTADGPNVFNFEIDK